MEEEVKNKKAALIVMGIFELLAGVLCAFMAAIMLIPLTIASGELPVSQILLGMAVYGVLAAWLITMGIGTLRARRWARVLMLAVSWLMLVCGIMAMVMMTFFMPKIFAAVEMSEAMIVITLAFTYGILTMVYLVFPAIGIFFYGNQNIRATIEHADPGSSWTQRCPLPVLILVIMLAMASGSILMMGFYNFTVPFFGTLLSGWQGAVVLLGCSVICITLLFGVYKLRPAAWWGVLTMLLLGTVSQLITFSRIDLVELYQAMGYSAQMLQQIQSMNWMEGSTYGWMIFFYAVPGFIFLHLLKRFFKPSTAGENYDG